MTKKRWSDEAKAALLVLDWPAFHAAFPEYTYDAWEVKRRRVVKAAEAEEEVEDKAAADELARTLLRQPPAVVPDAQPYLGRRFEVPDYVNFNIGFFDYETTGLKANFGRMLVFSVADALGRVTTLRADDPELQGRNKRDDSRLAAASRDILEQFDILVSWNGKRFDLRFLNGRLTLGGERPLRADLMHVDLLHISRHYLAWHSHRLDAVAKTLRTGNQKTELDFDAIEAARDGESWAIDNLVEHCEADCLTLREVFERYRSLLTVVHR